MKVTKRLFVVFALFLVTSGFVFVDDHLSKDAPPIDLNRLPLLFGGWQGKDYPVDERVKEILETEYILSRDYVNGSGNHAFLSVVYYPDNKIGFHNPESCNVGVGMKVLDKRLVPLTVKSGEGIPGQIEVNRLVLGASEPEKVIYYFFVTGNSMIGSYQKFRWAMMQQQLRFKRPSGAQVQLHIKLKTPEGDTRMVAEEFLSAFTPVVQTYF